jgi:hypothetical protein
MRIRSRLYAVYLSARTNSALAVEMLSDNGSPYIARETRIFAAQLGLEVTSASELVARSFSRQPEVSSWLC